MHIGSSGERMSRIESDEVLEWGVCIGSIAVPVGNGMSSTETISMPEWRLCGGGELVAVQWDGMRCSEVIQVSRRKLCNDKRSVCDEERMSSG